MRKRVFSNIERTIIGVIVCLLIIASINLATAKHTEETVDIFIKNPAYFRVFALVKCDYNNRTNKFNFEKTFRIPGESSITIRMSKRYKSCQIWPRIIW